MKVQAREDERSLLGIVILLAISSGIGLSIGRIGKVVGADAAYTSGVALAFVLVHLAFVFTGFSGDQTLLPICAAITVMGYSSLLRLRPDLALRQLGFVWLGCAVLFALATLTSRRRLVGKGLYILAASIVTLVATLAAGAERGGARSWLLLGPLGFQASEFAKIGCVLAGAAVLGAGMRVDTPADQRQSVIAFARNRSGGALLAAWAAAVLLTVAQRDLGSAMVMFIACVATLYVATGDRAAVVGSALAAGLGVWVASRYWDHVSFRFAIWLNPWSDPAGAGYQTIQALYAFSAGGVLGKGYGVGSPWVVPAAATDMLFAAIAEETGLAGALGIIAAFLLLVGRGYAVAMRARWSAGLVAAVASASMLAVQFFVIVAGNTGVLPLTGVTLPFASYGGSSMSASMALLGILMGCAAAPCPEPLGLLGLPEEAAA